MAEPRDFAILFRTNEQPRAFETELRRAKLPYVLLGGMSFFDRREVRDMLSYLRVLDSPRDEVSLLRIINSPPRGIGQKTVASLLEVAVGSGTAVWDVMQHPEKVPGLSAAAKEAIDRFTELIRFFQSRLKSGAFATMLRELNW